MTNISHSVEYYAVKQGKKIRIGKMAYLKCSWHDSEKIQRFVSTLMERKLSKEDNDDLDVYKALFIVYLITLSQ
jgi:hypothetical protein